MSALISAAKKIDFFEHKKEIIVVSKCLSEATKFQEVGLRKTYADNAAELRRKLISLKIALKHRLRAFC